MTKIFDPKRQLQDLALSQAYGVRQRQLIWTLLEQGEIPYRVFERQIGGRRFPEVVCFPPDNWPSVSLGRIRPIRNRLRNVGFELKTDRERQTIRLVWRGKRNG